MSSAVPARTSLLPVLAVGLAVGLLPLLFKPLFVLGIGGGALLFVFILRNPRLGLFLVAATIPLETVGRISSVTSNVPLTVPKLFTVATLAAFIIHVATRRLRFHSMPWMYYLVGFLAAAGLSLIGASEVPSGMEAILRFSTTAMFFFLVVQLIDSPEVLWRCLAVFIVACTLASSYSLIQRYLPGSTFEFRYGWEEPTSMRGGVEKDLVERHMVGIVHRSSGFSSHSILLALNVSLLLAPIAAFLGNTPRRAVLAKLFWLALAAILVASMVVTYSRTGFLIGLLALLLMVLRRLARVSVGKTVAVLVLLVVLAAALPRQYVDRVLSFKAYTSESASIKVRLEITKAALRQFLAHPLLGVGYGNRYGIFEYFTEYRDKKHAVTPHNAYVQLISQVGLVGFVPMLLFFWNIHRRMRRAVAGFAAQGQQDLARLGNALHISLLVFLASGFAVDLFDKGMANSWLIIGMCGGFILLPPPTAAAPQASEAETAP